MTIPRTDDRDSSENEKALDRRIDDFIQAWLQGRRPCIEDFLPPLGVAGRRRLLDELVANDLECRWQYASTATGQHNDLAGPDRPLLEQYVEKYSELGPLHELPLMLVLEEYRVRRRWGERPDHASYRGRFPGRGEPLIAALKDVDAELAREQPATCDSPTGPNQSNTRSPPPEFPAVDGYNLLRVLGRGGMGIVYEAWERALHRSVALKMIRAGGLASENERRRFRDEATAVAALKHPNIVQIHSIGDQDGCPFQTMELLSGGSLADKIAGTPVAANQAAELVEKLARAVHFAHAHKIVHRDLKPSNILFSQDNTPKIADFGLAKSMIADSGQTATGVIVGTPSYMSPEQAKGDSKSIGPKADIYALGAILYELLTGRPPFKAATLTDTVAQVVNNEPVRPSVLQPKTPRDLETICLKCLQKDPGRRYATAHDLADDLELYLANKPIHARPVGIAARSVRWCQRNRSVASLAASLVAVTFGALVVVIILWLNENRQRQLAETNANKARGEQRRAEEHLEEVERQRKLVEESFAEARATIDDFIRTSESELFFRPGFDEIRLKMFEIAIKYHENLAKRRDKDLSLLKELANFHEHVGNLYRHTEAAKFLEHHQKALKIREQLSRKLPEDIELQFACANSYNNIGLARESSKGALHDYDQSRQILERLVKQHPAEKKYRINLSKTYNNIGTANRREKDRGTSIEYFQKSLDLLEGVSKNHSDSYEIKVELAVGYNNIAILHGESGNFADARSAFGKSRQLNSDLFVDRPENYMFQIQEAMAIRGMGLAESKQGNQKEAADLFEEAIRKQRAALGKMPKNTTNIGEYRGFLFSNYRLLTGLLRDLRHTDAAVTKLLEMRTEAAGEPAELFAVAEGLALCIPLVGENRALLTDDERQLQKKYGNFAIETLQRAIGAGYKRNQPLDRNQALSPLRSLPEFQKLLADLEK